MRWIGELFGRGRPFWWNERETKRNTILGGFMSANFRIPEEKNQRKAGRKLPKLRSCWWFGCLETKWEGTSQSSVSEAIVVFVLCISRFAIGVLGA